MLSISGKEFLVWKKQQLFKGGDEESLTFLLDCIGGVSTRDINLLKINQKGTLYLKKI